MRAGILVDLNELRDIGGRFEYGVAASGAGPTVIAFGDIKNQSKHDFEKAIKDLFLRKKIGVELMWTRPSEGGVSFA